MLGNGKFLIDRFGRTFPYLRLSITDVCNFRCNYCLPNGYQKAQNSHFLQIDEIRRLISAMTSLGLCKVRLTGGEPTVRKDLPEIAQTLHQISGIKTIALTTNGLNLKNMAQCYFDAGINALNVSVDSLNAETFKDITGHNRLKYILEGIDRARDVGFKRIKINCVLIKGVAENELENYLHWAQREDISVRFIELMQTGDNQTYFERHHFRADFIEDELLKRGFILSVRAKDAGPAKTYIHPHYKGSVGLIAPYSKDFCLNCNRLRVTSRGELMLCLFGEHGYNLRHLLQDDEQMDELEHHILHLLRDKKQSHFLHQGFTGSTAHLASLGG